MIMKRWIPRMRHLHFEAKAAAGALLGSKVVEAAHRARTNTHAWHMFIRPP